MALSGTIYSSSFGNGYFRLRLVWSATQNVSANTSTIKTTLYLDSISAYGKISDATNSPWNINIDGGNTSGSVQSDVSANGSKTLGSHTRTVSHNSDGTKSLTISAGHTIDISYSGSTIGARSLSGSITLNTIPRTSTVGIQGSSTAEMGKYNGIFIKINRSSSSFTHTLRYAFGNKTGTIANKISWVDHEWTIPADFATEVTNSTSNWGRIICDTYNGDTKIGSSEVKFTATVPNNANYNPTITTPTLTEANTAVTSAVGAYWVQKNSKVKVSVTPATKYGATVSKVEITVKSAKYSGTTITTGALGDTGSHTVTAVVTDSRGRTATSSTSFTVVPYTAPKITSFTATRSAITNTTIDTIGSASMTAIGTANSTTIRVSTSPKGKNTWTTRKTVTLTTGTNITTGAVPVESLPITEAFDVKLEVFDELNPTPSTQIISVGTAIFPMSWGKTGVGVGTVFNPSGKALQVVGGAEIDEYISQRVPVGANLNNYTKTGFYYCEASADVVKMTNTPRDEAFSMIVERHAGIKQTFTTYRTDSIRMYFRNNYNGEWGTWKLLYDNSGWLPLTLRNVTRGNINYRFMEGTVNINGWFDRAGEQRSGIAIANLPTWASPNVDTRFLGTTYEIHTSYPEQHACTFLLKSTDGELSIQRKTGIERFYINETYMVKD